MSQAMKPKRTRIKTSKVVYTTSFYKNTEKDLVDSNINYTFVQQKANNEENTRIFKGSLLVHEVH
jgi:hypothetical protein